MVRRSMRTDAAQELREHAADIEAGRLTWHPRPPKSETECCAAMRGNELLSDDALLALSRYLRLERPGDEDYGPGVGRWNDKQTDSRVVVSVLRGAAQMIDPRS